MTSIRATRHVLFFHLTYYAMSRYTPMRLRHSLQVCTQMRETCLHFFITSVRQHPALISPIQHSIVTSHDPRRQSSCRVNMMHPLFDIAALAVLVSLPAILAGPTPHSLIRRDPPPGMPACATESELKYQPCKSLLCCCGQLIVQTSNPV